jgi:DNA-binding CsgD family transcriptional regulator
MRDVRDATWRFINLAPITGGQQALDDLFAETLRPFGVDRFDCGRIPTGDPLQSAVFISDRGMTDWQRYYTEQRFELIDPSPLVCGQFNGAYTWSDVKALTLDQPALRMWGDAQAADMREGLIVTVPPRRITDTVVRLVTPELRFDPDCLPLLQSISVVYASSVISLHSQRTETGVGSNREKPLTDREIECLHWVARGKTNAEMGVIMSISRHTVNTHIESAKRKLGVTTRVQAVALAHQMKLVSIA